MISTISNESVVGLAKIIPKVVGTDPFSLLNPSQILKVLSTDQFSILHPFRQIEHFELVPEAELPLEVLEVTKERPLALVEEAAERLGHLLTG